MSKRLNLSIVSNDLHVGGVQKNIVAFLKHIDRDRYNPSVCLVCAGGELVEEVRNLDIPVEIFKGVWKDPLTPTIKFPSPFIFRQVRQFYKRHQTDIAQTRLFLGNWFGRKAARRARVPVVVAAEHSTYTHKNFMHKFIDRRMAKYCQKIVTVSQTVKQFTVKQTGLPLNKFACIYNGIDLERFNGESSREKIWDELKIQPSRFVIGSCARIIPEKNYQHWYQVLQKLLVIYPHIKFVLVGDGPYLNKLKDYGKTLGIDENIVYTGQREDIPELLSSFDLFVLPSLREGLPTVILEAMAMNVPVLGNSLPQMQEIIVHGDNGFVFDFGDIGRTAEECIRLLAQPKLLQPIAEKGRKTIEQRFTIQHMVDNYCNLYESLLKNTR